MSPTRSILSRITPCRSTRCAGRYGTCRSSSGRIWSATRRAWRSGPRCSAMPWRKCCRSNRPFYWGKLPSLRRRPLQGLRHAVDAAAGLGDLAHIDLGDLEAARFELLDQSLADLRRDHAVAAEGHEVAPQVHRVLERHVDDFVALALQPI